MIAAPVDEGPQRAERNSCLRRPALLPPQPRLDAIAIELTKLQRHQRRKWAPDGYAFAALPLHAGDRGHVHMVDKMARTPLRFSGGDVHLPCLGYQGLVPRHGRLSNGAGYDALGLLLPRVNALIDQPLKPARLFARTRVTADLRLDVPTRARRRLSCVESRRST